ncbi:MAG TPA: Gfo/Idh/MocA family oxidoreductase [Solirubrobacteraceae bacterium]|nr:Gfo/Idh/MocA family oxidoreductase [Solirubrobacteraceae bacterium]
MSAPVRWGILSTAHINDKFLPGAREADNVEILAVASREGERARAYAAERGIPRAYGSYEELLADPDIEAVYIPLPNSMHVPWAVRGLEAGKHVLCEKPLARRAADAERVFAVAAERARLLSEAFMYRHHPQTRRLQELVAQGAVGELRVIRSHFSFSTAADTDVRLFEALEGGALLDVGCYCVNGSRMLAGEPASVMAMRQLGGHGVDVRFAATMRFPGGVLAHFDAGLDCAARHELEVVGAEGTILLRDPWHCARPVIELGRPGRELERIEIDPVNPYRLEAENFSAAVRGEAELLLGADDAIAQARAIEALLSAAAAGDGGGRAGEEEPGHPPAPR